ncbi:MAG: hypothetical protein FRX49_13590 [Trebouxia sp. A1-2]|nr:MAG: hypothetical protein FRX49_13590 [Trebouxia sp. A1-2]
MPTGTQLTKENEQLDSPRNVRDSEKCPLQIAQLLFFAVLVAESLVHVYTPVTSRAVCAECSPHAGPMQHSTFVNASTYKNCSRGLESGLCALGRATKHGSAAAFEGRIEASVRGCYAIMQKLQGPKAAALTVPRFCCRSEQSVIEHRALQKPPLDIAGVSLIPERLPVSLQPAAAL